MMIARLLLGALSSLCAGSALVQIAKGKVGAQRILGGLLTVLFIPVHYGLWDRFPLWCHAIFLAFLFPLTLLGFRLFTTVSVDRRDATT